MIATEQDMEAAMTCICAGAHTPPCNQMVAFKQLLTEQICRQRASQLQQTC